MENIKQSEGKKMQLPALDPNKTRLGGSGGLAVISGIAGGVAKGAFNLIKSVMKKRSATNARKLQSQYASKTMQGSLNSPGSPGVGRKAFASKPVDFKGPNPAHKTGAGGNSY